MPIDLQLADRVREVLEGQARGRTLALREKHIFGGLAFMLQDKMACGVIDRDLMVRVGPATYADALENDHARPMDFTGKPMRGYVFVSPEGTTEATALAYWLNQAVTHIEALTAGDS